MNDPKVLIGTLTVVALLFVALWARGFVRDRRRRRVFELPFPEPWQAILKQKFPLYNRLPEDLRQQLHGHMNVFLSEKYFTGHNGLEITDTVRVVIAAQACILLLNRKTRYFPHLKTIRVYPGAFTQRRDAHGAADEVGPVRLGESWHRGPVVLSWSDSEHGARVSADGHNVVMHEFAHQLDQEDGESDGAPQMPPGHYRTWGKVLSREFNALRIKAELGQSSWIDQYGATNAAEFFAVITEHFIEQPEEFLQRHPQLYQALKGYYRIDPVSWRG